MSVAHPEELTDLRHGIGLPACAVVVADFELEIDATIVVWGRSELQ